MLVLLPDDPDASAEQIRYRIRELTGREVAVLITDSFGRPWRQGTIDVGHEVRCPLLRFRRPVGPPRTAVVAGVPRAQPTPRVGHSRFARM